MDKTQLAQWLVESAFSLWCSGDLKTSYESLVGDLGIEEKEAKFLIERYGLRIECLKEYMEEMGLSQAESIVKEMEV